MTQPPEGPIQGEVLPAGPAATNSLAVVSFVMGVLGIVLAAGSILLTFVCCGGFPFVGLSLVLGIAAAVCGHLALCQVNQTGEQGRGLALAGLVTGYAGVGLSLVVIVLMVLGLSLFAIFAAAGQAKGH
jgi:hypothetical protein